MELTKEQRHEVYKLALDLFVKGGPIFVCTAVRAASIKLSYCLEFFEEEVNHFEELLTFKPANKIVGQAWWDLSKESYHKRVEVLKECIKMSVVSNLE